MHLETETVIYQIREKGEYCSDESLEIFLYQNEPNQTGRCDISWFYFIAILAPTLMTPILQRR